MLENSYLIQAWKYPNFTSKKDEHDRCYSLFLNKASLSNACLDTKIILWSRQRDTFKLANPKHEHRTERQSLVDSLSLSFLLYWTEMNNSHAKIV